MIYLGISLILVIAVLTIVGILVHQKYEASPVMKQLSDQDLLDYAKTPKELLKNIAKSDEMVFPDITLGQHNKAVVKVSFYTTDSIILEMPADVRIIHYDVPTASCPFYKGRIVTERIPHGIAGSEDSFCVPAVLYENAQYKK